MPLDTATLIATFRRDVDDPEMPGSGDDSDSLWSDAEITDYLAEAQEIMCTKADILFDSTTYELTTVDGTSLYAWDELITKIRRGSVAGDRDLEVMSVSELKRRYSISDLGWDLSGNWETAEGDPKYIITDYEVGYVRLVPIPTQVETIALHVYKLPDDNTVMEIPQKYRRELLLFAKYKAYDKNDADVHNERNALKYKELWKQALDELNHEEKRRNKSAQVVSYGGL